MARPDRGVAQPRRPVSGLTLSETIIAIFVLVSGFVVMFRLLHAALQYQAGIDSQQTAVMLAEREVEAIRTWSALTHGPGGAAAFADWSGCPNLGGPTPIADFPDYNVKVEAEIQALYSPCSLFELSYPVPTDRRILPDAVREVTVTVTWRDHTFAVRTLVAAPTGEPGPDGDDVEVYPDSPAAIAAAANSQFQAFAYDVDGRQLPNVCFVWYVAGVGDATLQPKRDGRGVKLINQIYDSTPPPAGPSPTGVGVGPCQVVARARYRGKEIRGTSGLLDLQGP